MRALGKIRQIVEEATGLEITHCHDDLVFLEHSVVLLRFDDSDFSHFFWYARTDCPPENRALLLAAFKTCAGNNGMHCSDAGNFSMTEKPETEEILIHFS